MKKAVILILAVLYLGITSGVAMNIHYCMGEVASVNYGPDTTDGCGKCGMQEKAGCCHTESKIIKVSDAHLFSNQIVDFSQHILLPLPVAVIPQPLAGRVMRASPVPPSPGNINNIPLHLYHCVFRI